MEQGRAVFGIDLGTTNSCIAMVDKWDQPVVLRNLNGDTTTPSVVYFENEDNIIIGTEAKQMQTVEPRKTVSFVKRYIGDDDSFNKQSNKFPYHFDPSEISAFILKKLVDDANELGGTNIKDVVITCPAYFGTKERIQTRQAGIMAGLNVLSIINEPVAAAIAYGAKLEKEKTFLVYDLGGGTFDVSLINIGNGKTEVIATGGDHHLGGVDWDTCVAEYILRAFNWKNNTKYNLEQDPVLKNKLLQEAEQKKKILTVKDSVKWNFTYKGENLHIDFTREMFDKLTSDLLEKTIDHVNKLLDISKHKGYRNFNEIVLVGGSSRMPQVKKRLDKEFHANAKLSDPDECVAKGAAVYALNMQVKKLQTMYEKGEVLQKSTDLTKGETLQKPIDLKSNKVEVINVMSKTYGLDVTVKTGLLKRKIMVHNFVFANTKLPYSKVILTTPLHNNQDGVDLCIYESDFINPEKDELVDPKHCILLDKRTLFFSKKYSKKTEIKNIYNIDKEGILSCSTIIGCDRIDYKLQLPGVRTEEEIAVLSEIIASKNIG